MNPALVFHRDTLLYQLLLLLLSNPPCPLLHQFHILLCNLPLALLGIPSPTSRKLNINLPLVAPPIVKLAMMISLQTRLHVIIALELNKRTAPRFRRILLLRQVP